MILEAFPGENSSDDHSGGDGYCGGGGGGSAKGAGRGGSDGEDGKDGDHNVGSCGSGLQIEQLSTKLFQLSPGEGGQTYGIGTGRGGGGVIVNGKMPGDNL